MYLRRRAVWIQRRRVLEPACGSVPLRGLMPRHAPPFHRHGIEIDPLTARMAKTFIPMPTFAPHAFEQTKLADGFYDLAFPMFRWAITPFRSSLEQLQIFHP